MSAPDAGAQAAITRLWTETAALVAGVPALAAFAGAALDGAPRRTAREPCRLGAVDGLGAFRGRASPLTAPLTEALIAAAPHLQWRQSYSEAQVGRRFLDGYAWVNVASPEGLFVVEGLRISIGTWAEGLVYPRHWHEPEEIYAVLAGRALFVTDGQPDRVLGPGETRHHPANVPHAARMDDSPLLAMALWRGRHLLRPPGIATDIAGGRDPHDFGGAPAAPETPGPGAVTDRAATGRPFPPLAQE